MGNILKSKPTLRIAVLEADTPLTKTRERYGSYGGVFKALFNSGAEHIDFPQGNLIMSNYDVVGKMDYPELEDIDAVLITGSRYDSFESNPWITKLVDFTRMVLAQDRVRVIGVCFGHQIVGRAMDVKVGRNSRGWEASVCDVDLTPKGKEIFGKDRLTIHQMHKDVVYAYPESVEKLGHSPKCSVQGMYVEGRLITVQGHPEFNEEIVREVLETRHRQGLIDDNTFQDMIGRVMNPQDGTLIAGAFINFLQAGR